MPYMNGSQLIVIFKATQEEREGGEMELKAEPCGVIDIITLPDGQRVFIAENSYFTTHKEALEHLVIYFQRQADAYGRHCPGKVSALRVRDKARVELEALRKEEQCQR